ncbi:MAG TPA: homoserine kinase [Chloroflexota bacterium]|nr:homoserine kinase [Chloroflexota bacterium]
MSQLPIVVRAPATSANLGAGFDCLGLALDLWNEVSATPGIIQPDDHDNLILRSARAVYDRVGSPYPGFELRVENRIPFGRGLGSSSAAIACGVLFANRCLGDPLDSAALLEIATHVEGHPDNVAPCLLGGVRVATVTEGGRVVQVHVPRALDLLAVLFVPEQPVPTAHARGVLPVSVPRADAVFNVARSSLFVAALAAGRADALAEATRDRLHQPYRLPLFPPGATLLDTAMHSGALGAFVSGAGPTILALCGNTDSATAVASAFDSTARKLSLPGVVLRLELVERGAHVVA